MALYIKISDGSVIATPSGGKVQVWEGTYYIPLIDQHLKEIRAAGKEGYIVEMIADGDELEHIRLSFEGIPIAYQITRWTGEMANFIASNLK